MKFLDKNSNKNSLIKSPKQRLETYCFCSVSYYYYYSYSSPFFPRTMNLSTADLRNNWTECHETWWSYRYMFLVGPFSMSGINSGHHCLPTYQILMISDNVEFLLPIFYTVFWQPFWKWQTSRNFENVELKMVATISQKINIVRYHHNLICG
jgi:hypothetical protein